MNKSNPPVNIQLYESYLSVFYKLMREKYTGRTQILNSYHISEKHHFSPIKAPRWLSEITNVPDSHLPVTYCPIENVLDPRKLIKLCPECIKSGYHSVFFMLKIVNVCPVHCCRLLGMCGFCSRRFLGDVSIDSYFDCPVDEGRVNVFCRCCEITWPDFNGEWLNISTSVDALGMLPIWEYHSDWYQAILKGVSESSELCKKYYLNVEDRTAIIAPLEAKYNLKSAERLLGAVEWKQEVYWVKFVNSLPGSDLSTDQYHSLRELVASICLEIKQRFLAGHEDCCASINALTEYLPMAESNASMCIPALAYVLFRLKLACAIWPTPNSVAGEKSCFDNLFNHIDPYIKIKDLRKLLTFIFLKIMGDVQYNVSKGRSLDIFLRPMAVSEDFFYFRKTMHSWRKFCCMDYEMERSCWISTDGDRNKLSVIWYHDQSPNRIVMIV